jgi:hypothetical protein
MNAMADQGSLRILLAAPRKSGAAHLRCLLASVYGLAVADPRGAPPSDDLDEIPEGAILATDRAFSPHLGASAERRGVNLVAIVRHPYDLFVSDYLVAQQRDQRRGAAGERAARDSAMAGKPIDDPAVLHYLESGFAAQMAWLVDWQQSGAAVVRLEDLLADPAATLHHLTERIEPVDTAGIDRALLVCPSESPVRSRPEIGRRMRVVPPDSWRDHLTPDHLRVFASMHKDALEALGYAHG